MAHPSGPPAPPLPPDPASAPPAAPPTAGAAPAGGLAGFRTEIDAIDDRVVDLLTRRFEICRAVAVFKQAYGIPVRLPDRIAEVKQRCTARAAAQRVDPELVEALYDLIIEATCRTEEAVQAGDSAVAPVQSPSGTASPTIASTTPRAARPTAGDNPSPKPKSAPSIP